jgi:glycosyltransferase involved in cell wall biosynthesis
MHLHRAGHCTAVAADPSGLLSHRLRDAGLPTHALRIRNHADFLAGLRLRQLVKSGQYAVVHFHTSRAHALSPWLWGLEVKRVVTRRMDYPVKKGLSTRFLYTGSVDAVVAISAGIRAALVAAEVPATCIRLIPSGVDTTRFTPDPAARRQIRQSHGLDAREPLVLATGALVERKGYQTLLQAAQHLKAQARQCRYLICGDGQLRSALQAQAGALGLERDVQFAGFCSDVAPYLAAADLFVHVPLWEGLGVAVIEALAAGLPVVASRVGGIPELITDQETGLLVPPQDPPALAAALCRLLDDPLTARALGQTGQSRVRARFDMAVMTQANETLYYDLLGSSH